MRYLRALQEEAVRTAPCGGLPTSLIAEVRDHNHPRPATTLLESAGCFQPVDARHIKVHEDHIGFEPLGQADSLFAVRRFTHHVYVRISCQQPADRKSTRLNSSHRCISYAVFCLKK